MSLKVPIKPVEVTSNNTWTETYTFAETTTANVPARGWGDRAAHPSPRHIGDFIVWTADTS